MGVDAVRKPFPELQDAETAIRVAYTGIPGAGTAVGYGLEDRVRVPVWGEIFFFQCRPDRLRGSPYLLSNGHWGSFLFGG
jgi:hypothetical protein